MSQFQKRHYEAIADALRKARIDANGNTDALYGIGYVQANISDVFADDNPRFDGERFAQAAGMRGIE